MVTSLPRDIPSDRQKKPYHNKGQSMCNPCVITVLRRRRSCLRIRGPKVKRMLTKMLGRATLNFISSHELGHNRIKIL